jgi:hypothetical protein
MNGIGLSPAVLPLANPADEELSSTPRTVEAVLIMRAGERINQAVLLQFLLLVGSSNAGRFLAGLLLAGPHLSG